jgi:hypothetical protein
MEQNSVIQELLTTYESVHTTEDWIYPLLECVAELSAEDAAWKPTSDERSIWEIVLHIISWMDYTVIRLKGQEGVAEDWPPVIDTSKDAWEATLAQLKKSCELFREQIGSANAETLLMPQPGMDVSPFWRMNAILIHNAYHAGQIVKLRGLRVSQ